MELRDTIHVRDTCFNNCPIFMLVSLKNTTRKSLVIYILFTKILTLFHKIARDIIVTDLGKHKAMTEAKKMAWMGHKLKCNGISMFIKRIS